MSERTKRKWERRSGGFKERVLERMKRDDLTVHGFRSSFRDWAAERTSYPGEVAEMALAHKVSDKVEAAYRRGDMFDKRRRFMANWCDFCRTPIRATGGIGWASC